MNLGERAVGRNKEKKERTAAKIILEILFQSEIKEGFELSYSI